MRIKKEEIRLLLRNDDPVAAMETISRYPARKVINNLISLYCDPVPLVRWRAIDATGKIVSDHADADRESARVIMRRLMWMLNDESGGIGWGAPEAMGAIMARHSGFASEYESILLSYVEPACNFLEHPVLQRGVLWGVGMLARSRPETVRRVLPNLRDFLASGDPWHRGYAAWAIGFAGNHENIPNLEPLKNDDAIIDIYTNGRLDTTTVGFLAQSAIDRIIRFGKDS